MTFVSTFVVHVFSKQILIFKLKLLTEKTEHDELLLINSSKG